MTVWHDGAVSHSHLEGRRASPEGSEHPMGGGALKGLGHEIELKYLDNITLRFR